MGQVGREDINADGVVLTQPGGERFQARYVTGDQYEVVAACGKAFGVGGANAGRSASDQNGSGSAHGVMLCECEEVL